MKSDMLTPMVASGCGCQGGEAEPSCHRLASFAQGCTMVPRAVREHVPTAFAGRSWSKHLGEMQHRVER